MLGRQSGAMTAGGTCSIPWELPPGTGSATTCGKRAAELREKARADAARAESEAERLHKEAMDKQKAA